MQHLSWATSAEVSHHGAHNRSHQKDSYTITRDCGPSPSPRRAVFVHSLAKAVVRRFCGTHRFQAGLYHASQNDTWLDHLWLVRKRRAVILQPEPSRFHRSCLWYPRHFLHLLALAVVHSRQPLPCSTLASLGWIH